MKHIKGFDTLRAFSIVLVLLSHAGLHKYLPENDFFQIRVWGLISGTTGVYVFFALSGFLITRLLLKEKQNSGKIAFLKFYMRRFIRLLPPLLLFYSIIAVLMYFDQLKVDGIGFLYSFFYLYNFVPMNHYWPELVHTWTLALEEQYYLIWPFIISSFSNKKTIRIISVILILCGMATFLWSKFEFTSNFKSERWFLPAVAPILIGSLFAVIISKTDKYQLKYHLNYKLLLIAILLFLFPIYSPKFMFKLSYLFQSVGISMLLTWILYNQETKLTNLLNNKGLSYIGKISYGIYVYQGLFLRSGPGGELWIQQMPQNIILTLAVAILSFEFLEKPVLKLKNRFR
jgi:peptidoglycan/LPS O-acetylase OafA/YrhL